MSHRRHTVAVEPPSFPSTEPARHRRVLELTRHQAHGERPESLLQERCHGEHERARSSFGGQHSGPRDGMCHPPSRTPSTPGSELGAEAGFPSASSVPSDQGAGNFVLHTLGAASQTSFGSRPRASDPFSPRTSRSNGHRGVGIGWLVLQHPGQTCAREPRPSNIAPREAPRSRFGRPGHRVAVLRLHGHRRRRPR